MPRGERRGVLYSAAGALIVLGLGFAFAPRVYGNETLLFSMMTYVTLAEGLNLLYGFTGYLPFGYVGFFGAGAYATALLVRHGHLPMAACILGGGAGAVVTALILGPLLRLTGAYFSIASLAASQILYSIVSNEDLSRVTGGPYGVNIQSAYDPAASYTTMLVIMLATVALAAYFRLSRFGMALRALFEDATSASMIGIDVVRARLVVWVLSAAAAGLAGGAYAWYISVFYPDAVFTLEISVFAIVFALFGGVGTVSGPVVGAIVLYALYNGIGISAPQYFEFLYGLLIVLLVLFLPNGLLSLRIRRGTRAA